MPLSPLCAPMKSVSWRRALLFARMASCRFGRSKPWTKTAGGRANRRLQDVPARGLVGGRGQRHDLNAGELGGEISQIEIVGAEIVPPLRDAVRLVDGEQRDARFQEHRPGVVERQPLGRDVEQAQVPAPDGVEQGSRFPRGCSPELSAPAAMPKALELRHLVAHQRDQRRDHDGQPVAQQRRQLIAERLAAARRHHREHVPALKDRGDNIPLSRAEIREPEGLAQRFPRLVQNGHSLRFTRCAPAMESAKKRALAAGGRLHPAYSRLVRPHRRFSLKV